MSNTRVLRVSSTRDVCIFCTTRQFTVDGINYIPLTTFPARSQRRHLNSSSKAPQYAAEGQVFREEPQRMTQAERMRQQMMANPRYTASRQQTTYVSPAERARAALQAAHPARVQAQSQRQGLQDQFPRAPVNMVRRVIPGGDPLRNTRYRVNMDSRGPPVSSTPEFGSVGHLRRRNNPQAKTAWNAAPSRELPQPMSTQPTKRKWAQGDLEQMLGANSNLPRRELPRSHIPLTRKMSTPMKCFHCGQQGHRTQDCLLKPVVRQPEPAQQREGALADAAEAWIRKQRTRSDEPLSAEQARYEEEGRRRDTSMSDRRRSRFVMEDEIDLESRGARNQYEEPEPRRRGKVERRGRGRVMQAEDEDLEEEYTNKAERKRQRKEAKKRAQLEKAEPTPVYLPEYISVANLASVLKMRVEDFVKKLEDLGFEDVQNDHILNAEHAGLIAQEYNFEPIIQAKGEDGDIYAAPARSPEDYAKLPPRPPVVTIMGHVDHGKTTILDYIRKSSVAATEFGGITQHIGAFSVPLVSGKKITFLDTPGHAAFETMRARGANVTDIVVLVVAADDSVMPQTIEAIKHAQAAKVPIIVAINKIDKEQAHPDRVKQDLGRHGVEVEEYGGDVQTVLVSGKTGQGIPDLEEAISLQSEVLDHRADPEANVEGWVLEGTTKKSGKVATVLVRNGTLRQGDILVAGTTWTRVRALRNEAGAAVKEIGPGMPVEVDGWREQPIAGDEALQASSEQQAAQIADLRTEKLERLQMAKDMEAINETRRLEAERREADEAAAKAAKAGETIPEEVLKKESGPEIVSFIVKADVSGSAEAVVDSITAIGNNEVGARILRSGVGSPSEFDVQHAADAGGHIVNFNTIIQPNIAAMAEGKGVKILDSNIIYRVVENVKALMSEKLSPKITQRVTGEAEIAAAFEIGLGGRKKLRVAGSKVRNGAVVKGTKVRVLRKEEVVFDGILSSLKSQKKDVHEMRKDTECGIAFEGWEAFEVGDKLQCYEEKSEKRTL
ncbi:initiation factor 2 [Lindgomyces ingoldianus]|uniref:Initiation factor 2 n=1 Tax=Lindgomyces ingoldianus TaxID=673940 RepID=A0ACB6QTI3_9PLEO|nr:initiation factor 2 [Lindgomyces ingoldianus]KAF2470293.1 initiation factor 2 [Lindgomyces ingoldianus]